MCQVYSDLPGRTEHRERSQGLLLGALSRFTGARPSPSEFLRTSKPGPSGWGRGLLKELICSPKSTATKGLQHHLLSSLGKSTLASTSAQRSARTAWSIKRTCSISTYQQRQVQAMPSVLHQEYLKVHTCSFPGRILQPFQLWTVLSEWQVLLRGRVWTPVLVGWRLCCSWRWRIRLLGRCLLEHCCAKWYFLAYLLDWTANKKESRSLELVGLTCQAGDITPVITSNEIAFAVVLLKYSRPSKCYKLFHQWKHENGSLIRDIYSRTSPWK